jgi:hypothetical protein
VVGGPAKPARAAAGGALTKYLTKSVTQAAGLAEDASNRQPVVDGPTTAQDSENER